MRISDCIASALKTFRTDERGASAVEFALISTVMSVIMLNVVDIAYFMYNKMEVTGAVRAGAQYAIVNTKTSTPALVGDAVQGATALSPLTIAVDDNLCGCSNGVTFVCGAVTCAGGTTGRTHRYTAITSAYTHDWIFYPGTTTVSAAAQVRTY